MVRRAARRHRIRRIRFPVLMLDPLAYYLRRVIRLKAYA
jgi:hypothetical protein